MAMLPAQAPPGQGPIPEIGPRLAGGPFRGLAVRSDERLVSTARQGDERAFEILYERHAPAILRYCRSLLRSTQEAEDVKQEVFVLAISALRRGAEPDAFRPWLYRIAHNACMSHLRMRRPVLVADDGVLVGPAAATEPAAGHREELRQLLDDIGKLPDVQRGALLLREMDGFSYEQVGEVLGLPPSTVRASIFRARRTLQGLAEARDADCEAIQSELTELADRRGRRGRHITSHLTVCETCRDFRDGLRRRSAVLGGVTPVGPAGPAGVLVALKGKLLGGAAAGGSGAVIATAGGGAGVAKIAAVAASSIALLAGMGVEADHAIEHARRPAATRHATVAAGPAPVVRTGPRVASAGIAAGPALASGPATGEHLRSRVVGSRRTAAGSSSRAHARGNLGGVGGGGAVPAPRRRTPHPADPAAVTAPPAPAGEEHRQGGGSGPGDRDHRRGRDGGDGDRGSDARGRSGNSGSARVEEPSDHRAAGDGDGNRDGAAISSGDTSGSSGGAPSSSSPSSSGSSSAPPPAPAPTDGDGSSGAVGTDSSGGPAPAPPPPPAPAPDPVPAPEPAPTAGNPGTAPAPDPAPPAGDAGTAGTAATTPVDPGAGAIPPTA